MKKKLNINLHSDCIYHQQNNVKNLWLLCTCYWRYEWFSKVRKKGFSQKPWKKKIINKKYKEPEDQNGTVVEGNPPIF